MLKCNLCFIQVRTLSELGWFLTIGTAAQLFALVVVVVKLFMSPLEGKHSQLVQQVIMLPVSSLDLLKMHYRMGKFQDEI